jgi:hypothetical protein
MYYVIDNMYPILGAILLACFSAWLGYRTYLKTRKINAADKFKSAILNELHELYPEGVQTKNGYEVKAILRLKHSKLQSIIIEYGEFLKSSDSLQKAWYEFSGVGELRDVGEEAKYNHYSFTALTDGTPFSKDPQALFIANVNALLACAK